MSDTAVNLVILSKMSTEALRYDLARAHAHLEYLGAFRDGNAAVTHFDGLDVQLVNRFEAMQAEYGRRHPTAA